MANYWVDPAGNDGDPGTPAQPWATMQHAADTAVAGDTVTFNDGTYGPWDGDDFDTNAGTALNPIVFQADNTGLAILEYNNSVNTKWDISVDYLTFDGLVLDADQAPISATVRIVDADGLIFQNCTIRETRGIGLRIFGNTDGITVQDCTIYPNYDANQGRDGIQIRDDNGVNSNVIITGCTIHHTDHTAIHCNNAQTALIAENTIYASGSHGISVLNGVDNITIRDNIIHGEAGWGDQNIGMNNGIFIHENGVQTVEVYRNQIYECGHSGIYLRDNLIGPINIYNNTIYDTNKNPTYFTVGSLRGNLIATSPHPVIRFKNNIVHTINRRALYFTTASHTDNLDMDYNLWYATTNPSGQECRIEGTTYSTFALYQAAGYEPNSLMQQDPDFTDKANGNFILLPGSPAIDAGTDVGLPYQGPAPDMGALETGAGGQPVLIHITIMRTTTRLAIATRIGACN